MHVLVTRPEPDGSALAEELRTLGHTPILAPMMTIEFEEAPPPVISGGCALAFTSANGVRAFCHRVSERHWPVFAVGEATAELARHMGFSEVYAAGGDVETLADMIGQHDYLPNEIFHASGADVAGDLAGRLHALGIQITSQQMYVAKAAAELPPPAATALERRQVDAVLFFSPRTAAIFASLAFDEKLQEGLGKSVAICMSQNVATAIKPLPFAEVRVSSAPTKTAVLEALEMSGRQA